MLTEQLAERLKALAESAEQLSPDAQNLLAGELAATLDNALWDAQLQDQRHIAVLRELAEEARNGPKRRMPRPSDTGDEDALDTDTLAVLMAPEREE